MRMPDELYEAVQDMIHTLQTWMPTEDEMEETMWQDLDKHHDGKVCVCVCVCASVMYPPPSFT
jgi:hypothetical protein